MKTFILGLVLSLFLINTASATHLTRLGWCSGKSYFSTAEVSNNFDVDIRYDLTGPSNTGTNWVSLPIITTPATGSTNIQFDVPQDSMSVNKTIVQFRYRVHGTSLWSEWSGEYENTSTLFGSCATLPVKFTSFRANLVKTIQ